MLLTNEAAIVEVLSRFICHVSKVLPDDIIRKLNELRAQETEPLPKLV